MYCVLACMLCTVYYAFWFIDKNVNAHVNFNLLQLPDLGQN